MFREYSGDAFAHSPEMSGPPSGNRGGGAFRFGLPSGGRWNSGRRVPEPLSCELPAQDDREDGDETCFHGLLPERIVP